MMAILQEEELLLVKHAARIARWLPLLEEELKSRIGWADEAVSPFALAGRTANAKPDLPQAA